MVLPVASGLFVAGGAMLVVCCTEVSTTTRNGGVMSDPQIAQNKPYVLELEPGTYWWCACGRSKGQPFCDGSHKGTEFTPVKLELEEKSKVWLCGCKHSADKPHCDGTHKRL
jgi:CDGSH-type Zn-finger protein